MGILGDLLGVGADLLSAASSVSELRSANRKKERDTAVEAGMGMMGMAYTSRNDKLDKKLAARNREWTNAMRIRAELPETPLMGGGMRAFFTPEQMAQEITNSYIPKLDMSKFPKLRDEEQEIARFELLRQLGWQTSGLSFYIKQSIDLYSDQIDFVKILTVLGQKVQA